MFLLSANETCILPQMKFVFYRKWNIFPQSFPQMKDSGPADLTIKRNKRISKKSLTFWRYFGFKAGLHQNANTNAACENDAYVHVGKFVDCLAFAEAANRPYIKVLYTNSLWCTDSRRIAFSCSPNVRHTAECCLSRLRNTSTSNVRIVFACRVRVRILFAFRCKRGFIR